MTCCEGKGCDCSCHKQEDIPIEHRICNRIRLDPETWKKFCEIAGLDPIKEKL